MVWHQRLCQLLLSCGFNNSFADAAMFIKCYGGDKIYIVIYVDDFIILGSPTKTVHTFIDRVCTLYPTPFHYRNWESFSFFLGWKCIKQIPTCKNTLVMFYRGSE